MNTKNILSLKNRLNNKAIREVWRALRWLIVAAVVGLMAWVLYEDGPELSAALLLGNPVWLIAALLLNLAGSLVYVTAWDSCARQLGATGGWRGALVALSVAGAARYLPGAIWPVAGLIYFSPTVGLPRKTMPVLAALTQILHLLAAFLVGIACVSPFLLTLPLTDNTRNSVVVAVGLSLGLGLATVGLAPRYLALPLKKLLGLDRSRLNLWQPLLRSIIFWLLNGLRLWLLVLAFGDTSPLLLPYTVWLGAATTLLSAGFFFVPLGIGVIELSIGWWLSFIVPLPVALAVVALNRLLRTVNDFFFLGLSKILTN